MKFNFGERFDMKMNEWRAAESGEEEAIVAN